MEPGLKCAVEDCIEASTAQRSAIVSSTAVGGGCVNQASQIRLQDGRLYFLKSNPGTSPKLFASEAQGLTALRASGALRVPEVIGTGTGAQSFILMEWIRSGSRPARFFETFGRSLAQLHQNTPGERFGFEKDNFLGSTPQPNGYLSSWPDFWRRRRLGHQLDLARRNGLGDDEMQRLGQRLLDKLEAYLPADSPPRLIHGDLWSGNFLCGQHGEPALIDPAAYYGCVDAELAMCRLFGGFKQAFYDAYREAAGQGETCPVRTEIYQLYHLLNHLNLFGGGYYSSCMQILKRYA